MVAFFSVLGIALGVATLIIVLSVMNGFRAELLSKIIGINGHLFATPIDRSFNDWQDLSERLSKVAGVSRPPCRGRGAWPSPPRNMAAPACWSAGCGRRIDTLAAVTTSIRGGTLEGFDDGTGVLIGKRLADSLGLQAGDTITLSTPKGASTPFGTAPRTKSYIVKGVFEVGMTEFDQTFVFMPLAESQTFFNREGDVSLIEIYVEDPDHVGDMREPWRWRPSGRCSLTDWRQRNRTFFGALEVERNVMFLILSLMWWSRPSTSSPA